MIKILYLYLSDNEKFLADKPSNACELPRYLCFFTQKKQFLEELKKNPEEFRFFFHFLEKLLKLLKDKLEKLNKENMDKKDKEILEKKILEELISEKGILDFLEKNNIAYMKNAKLINPIIEGFNKKYPIFIKLLEKHQRYAELLAEYQRYVESLKNMDFYINFEKKKEELIKKSEKLSKEYEQSQKQYEDTLAKVECLKKNLITSEEAIESVTKENKKIDDELKKLEALKTENLGERIQAIKNIELRFKELKFAFNSEQYKNKAANLRKENLISLAEWQKKVEIFKAMLRKLCTFSTISLESKKHIQNFLADYEKRKKYEVEAEKEISELVNQYLVEHKEKKQKKQLSDEYTFLFDKNEKIKDEMNRKITALQKQFPNKIDLIKKIIELKKEKASLEDKLSGI